MDTLESFLAQQTEDLKRHFTRINELQWQASTTGSPEIEAQLSAATTQLRLMLAEPARYDALTRLMAGVVDDPLVQRQATLLIAQQDRLLNMRLNDQIDQDARMRLAHDRPPLTPAGS